VDCTTAREALSARLDGELSPVMGAALDEHLSGCAACTAADGALARVTRGARLQVAPQVPDLAGAVVEGARARRGRDPWSPARVGLVVVALAQLVLSVPLLLGDAAGASLHTAREVGVTEVALAVGLFAAAWRPWRAAGMLPVVVALALGLAAVSLLDVLAGEVGLVDEVAHLLPLGGALLLWQVRHRDPVAPRPAPVRGEVPRLRRSA
jgi:predicted anti-sigma-YlaC factor YlaD